MQGEIMTKNGEWKQKQQSSCRKYVSRLANFVKIKDGKLVIAEENINNLHSQQQVPLRIVSEDTGRIKTPYFDVAHPYPYLNSNSRQ